MQKHRLSLLLFLVAGLLHAQSTERLVSVYFDTDRSELSPEARQTLDALLPSLQQAPDYQVSIEAYADDRGTVDYNRELAARRAAAVQDYLSGKGLVADKSSVTNWGEGKSDDVSETGRQRYRRVDLRVNNYYLRDLGDLQARFAANTEQHFSINTTETQTVRARNGAVVQVPAKAFVFEDGSPVTAPVDLEIQEAYQPSEFLLHQLTTLSEGRILQTGGMVSITATSNGKPLRLADDKELMVALPDGGKFDPNMELFYAETAPDGKMNWKPTGKKFNKKQPRARAELDVDPAIGARVATLPVQELPLPKAPVLPAYLKQEPLKPQAPYRPRAPKKPEWQQVQTMFGVAGEARPNRKALKKAQNYYQAQVQRYQRDSARYVELDARYQRNRKAYALAQERYARDLRQWDAEVKQYLVAVAQYQQDMYCYYYAKNLKLALKKRGASIRQYETYTGLANAVDGDAEGLARTMMYSNGLREDLNRMQNEKASDIYVSIFGSKLVDRSEHFQSLRLSAVSYPDTMEQITRRMLAATGIMAISDSLREAIKEKNLLNPQSAGQQQQALNGYVITVAKLGWINCDRFYNDPAEKMQVQVQEPEEATLYAVCQDIDAMLPFYAQSDGTYVANGLPKGKKITVVGFRIKDGMVEYARRDVKVGEAPLSGLSYRAMALRDLKEELKKLNI